MNTQPGFSVGRDQRGATLVVVLILLLAMTILGVASLRGVLMEERMASNMLDRSYAFQAAEAALREGEQLAEGRPLPAAGSGCVNGVCSKPDPADPGDNARWLADGFWDDESHSLPSETRLGAQAVPARFIVELIDANLPSEGSCTTGIDVSPDATCSGAESRYRITARSQGTGRAEVLLQSIYAVP